MNDAFSNNKITRFDISIISLDEPDRQTKNDEELAKMSFNYYCVNWHFILGLNYKIAYPYPAL